MRGELPSFVGMLLLVSACGSAPEATLQLSTGPGYEAELARVNHDLAAAQERVSQAPDQWKRRELAASLLAQRARLTGDLNDYAVAEAELEAAFAIAPQGSGPLLTRAGLNYSLHRLPLVEPDLVVVEGRVVIDDPTKAAVVLLRANTRFQQGDTAAAAEGVSASLALHDTGSGWSSLGRQAWLLNDYSAAEAHYSEAEARYHGIVNEPRAWFHLQRGLMDLDRARYADALDHYLAADAALPGYWLVYEHIAEVLVALEREAEAEGLYLDVIERTGNPELMDALAELYESQRRRDEAAGLRARARAGHQAALAQFPEAAAGHALGHWLDTGDDIPFTVALAEANVAARDNALSRISLADAYLLAGRDADALAAAETFLASPIRTADGLATAAEAVRRSGDRGRARELCAEASAIAPGACD